MSNNLVGGSVIQLSLRGDTRERWLEFNPVLADREFVIETDTRQFKIGNGVSQYQNLPYGGLIGPSGIGVPSGGTSGQIIAKSSLSDYSTEWVDQFTGESPTLTGLISLNGSVRFGISEINETNIDCSTGNYFTKTISDFTTFTISNAPIGSAYYMTLLLVNGGSSPVVWPVEFKWPGGFAPPLTAEGIDLIVAVTDDGGLKWNAAALRDIK